MICHFIICYHSSVANSCLILVTPWTIAHQAPLSMGFNKQEYCSGLPFPSPEDLPHPGMEPGSPALQADSSQTEPPGKPLLFVIPYTYYKYIFHLKSFLEVDVTYNKLHTFKLSSLVKFSRMYTPMKSLLQSK